MERPDRAMGQVLFDPHHDRQCCDLSRPRPNASHHRSRCLRRVARPRNDEFGCGVRSAENLRRPADAQLSCERSPSKEVSAKEIDLRFGRVRFSSGTWPLMSTGTGASAPASLSPARNFVVSRAEKAYDPRGESCGLPPASCPSRLSSNRTRIVVPVLELFRTSVPRSDIALAWISVLTPNHISVCVDGEYTTAYSWH
jgi:hypothetical protein